MKFPLSWLKEYVNTDLSAEDIADSLTSLGIEVDGITSSLSTVKGVAKRDSIFEVGLTPNLGRCSSLLGIARELSAFLEKPFLISEFELKEPGPEIKNEVKVFVEDKMRCPRYACRLIKNVTVAPSPEWLQQRLIACGLRPVNNVVDITNYVLLELGQPLHAFDFDKLKDRTLIVRAARENDRFVTLDGRERELSSEDLLICDGEKVVALAGVMGGLNSEVTDSTQEVLLEAAHFLPNTVRRTSKRLGLQTDSSKRFERHVDPNLAIQALNRAAFLIQELADGQVCKGSIDIKEKEFLGKEVLCRFSRINQILGTQLSLSEVEDLLLRLDLKTEWDGKDLLKVYAPTYRSDIATEIDIIEEIARLYGYDNIVNTSPRFHSSLLTHAPIYLLEKQVRARLVAEGLQEFITCDLIGPTIVNISKEASMSPEETIKVLNPTSVEQSILRTSLLPGLLQLVKYNYAHDSHDISGFEIGRLHFKEKDQYKEQSAVGIILTGKGRPHDWKQKPDDFDFFDLKGILEDFLALIGIEKVSFQTNGLPSFHPGRQLAIYVESLEIGSFGEVHPEIVQRLDVPQRIYFAEINLHDLYKLQTREVQVRALPIYPGSTRDWTITLKEEASIEKLLNAMRLNASPLLEEVKLIDLYESEALGKGKRNITFRFVYRDREKTIAQEAVDAAHARLLSEVAVILAEEFEEPQKGAKGYSPG